MPNSNLLRLKKKPLLEKAAKSGFLSKERILSTLYFCLENYKNYKLKL